jgi:exodeoxyribonuclease VII large subunit
LPTRIGVISSVAAAGYADFIKILEQRLGGMTIEVANVQVQGEAAPRQIIAALEYFNQSDRPPEIIAILRGGGSIDDLAAFNDELLVRAIAASRVPIITGIGHEIDQTLADLVADRRAATPTNAAQILVPDRRELARDIDQRLNQIIIQSSQSLGMAEQLVRDQLAGLLKSLEQKWQEENRRFDYLTRMLSQLDPRSILRLGYSIVRDKNGKIISGSVEKNQVLTIENSTHLINVKVLSQKGKGND